MLTQQVFAVGARCAAVVCVVAVGVFGSRQQAVSSEARLASALSGTAWQLAQITLVGDSARPDDGTKYTITFGPNRRAQIRADCNRGVASWHTGDDDELAFGAVKMTRVKCAGGSMHQRFVNDLAYVRSYTLDSAKLSLILTRGAGSLDFTPLAK